MEHDHDPGPTPFWRTRFGIGLLVLGAVAGYFLVTEHLAHLAGALPYLFLLACPLMHVFMHHGHGHGHQGGHSHGDQGAQQGGNQSGRNGDGKTGGW
jgi:hypothetical protein